MTLTKEDLNAISQLLDTKFQSELQPIKNDIRTLKEDVQMLKSDVQSLKEEVQILKEDVQSLKDRVQNLENRVYAMELHMENVTDKNIQILAENYMPAAVRYEKALSQMERMQADIEIIKKVVIRHSRKIQALG